MPSCSFSEMWGVLMILLLIIQPTVLVSASFFGNSDTALVQEIDTDIVNLDLGTFIPRSIMHKKEFFIKALDMVKQYDKAPSCTRVAVHDLLHSCGHLSAVDGNQVVVLEKIKSIFAARLALCELIGANAKIPSECTSLNTLQACDSKTLVGRDSVSKTSACLDYTKDQSIDVEGCLKALSTKSTWWVSYSNALQNAVVICSAARNEIEQAEALDVYRSVIELSSELSQYLVDSLNMHQEAMAYQKHFAAEVHSMQAQTGKNHEVGIKKNEELFMAMLHNMEVGFGSIFNDVFRNAQVMMQVVDTISSQLQNSSNLGAKLVYLLSEVAKREGEQSAQRTKDAAVLHERSVAISQSLEVVDDAAASLTMSLNIIKSEANEFFREIIINQKRLANDTLAQITALGHAVHTSLEKTNRATSSMIWQMYRRGICLGFLWFVNTVTLQLYGTVVSRAVTTWCSIPIIVVEGRDYYNAAISYLISFPFQAYPPLHPWLLVSLGLILLGYVLSRSLRHSQSLPEEMAETGRKQLVEKEYEQVIKVGTDQVAELKDRIGSVDEDHARDKYVTYINKNEDVCIDEDITMLSRTNAWVKSKDMKHSIWNMVSPDPDSDSN